MIRVAWNRAAWACNRIARAFICSYSLDLLLAASMRTFLTVFSTVSCFLLVHENQNIEIDQNILPSMCFIFIVACSDWGHCLSIGNLFDIWGKRPIPWCCDEKIVLTRADMMIYLIEFKCKRKNSWKKKEKKDKAFYYLERKIINIKTPWNWNYRDKFHPCLIYRSHENFWSRKKIVQHRTWS